MDSKQSDILQKAKSASHRGLKENGTLEASGDNPFCGDSLCMQASLNGQILESVRFDGYGCSLCIAAAETVCSLIEGRESEMIDALCADDICRFLGNIDVGRTRRGCIDLPLQLAKEMIAL